MSLEEKMKYLLLQKLAESSCSGEDDEEYEEDEEDEEEDSSEDEEEMDKDAAVKILRRELDLLYKEAQMPPEMMGQQPPMPPGPPPAAPAEAAPPAPMGPPPGPAAGPDPMLMAKLQQHLEEHAMLEQMGAGQEAPPAPAQEAPPAAKEKEAPPFAKKEDPKVKEDMKASEGEGDDEMSKKAAVALIKDYLFEAGYLG